MITFLAITMYYDVCIYTFGKCIVLGEHAVIRGCPAIIYPIRSRELHLTYNHKPTTALYIESSPTVPNLDTLDVIKKLLKYAWALKFQSPFAITGSFKIQNTIPIGAGMGSSAALCGAIALWFCAQKLIGSQEIFSFARSLEDVFHGKSSGADVAAVLSFNGQIFQQGAFKPLNQKWSPYWYLSHSKETGNTSQCIKSVQKLHEIHPKKALYIDKKMQESVYLAQSALEKKDGLKELAFAIRQGGECFSDWQLITPMLKKHIQDLYNLGAKAVKPTGSGGGGHVLSLWDAPPNHVSFPLIAV